MKKSEPNRNQKNPSLTSEPQSPRIHFNKFYILGINFFSDFVFLYKVLCKIVNCYCGFPNHGRGVTRGGAGRY